jgi:hypothetical protein
MCVILRRKESKTSSVSASGVFKKDVGFLDLEDSLKVWRGEGLPVDLEDSTPKPALIPNRSFFSFFWDSNFIATSESGAEGNPVNSNVGFPLIPALRGGREGKLGASAKDERKLTI